MTRDAALRELVANGHEFSVDRLFEVAAEYGLLASDVFVIAGRSVPARLLPPARAARVVQEFAYRVTFCGHAELAVVDDFVRGLSPPGPVPSERPADVPSEAEGFARILAGFLRNRGFGVRELPFTGLSLSTIYGMLSGRWHNLQQLNAIAGPLGWSFADLALVAGEPLGPFNDCSALCHHVGQVYVSAIPLGDEQLIQAAVEADRLSGRVDHGAWRPVMNDHPVDCP